MTEAVTERRRRGPSPALDAQTERARLLEAATTVVRRSGVDSWTLDEVLAEAGLGTRSCYRHFASKDALLVAVLVAEAQAAGERLQGSVDAAPDARAALDAWVDGILTGTRDSHSASLTRQLLRTFAASGNEGSSEAGRALASTFTRPLATALERGLVDGTFPNAVLARDVPMIFTLTFGVVTDMGGWATAQPLASVHDSLMRYILPALGADPGSSRDR